MQAPFDTLLWTAPPDTTVIGVFLLACQTDADEFTERITLTLQPLGIGQPPSFVERAFVDGPEKRQFLGRKDVSRHGPPPSRFL
jgi:hypothetical protein